uniref:Uncharacterized protein n=1 Tax=Tanacetum cinerariifolium TaxID=118510 RepID=A0A6L2L8Q7_TANCI|nr:hypothetical protein [Tanacetum cinerariifolium]
MRNEELNTIPEKESDEFIKSSVEDLVPIQSEFEDTSGSDSEYILPSCDDFSPNDIPKEKAVTLSNRLFNSNDDFISSDDESLSDEDVPEDNVKIYLNPLFEFDDEYISSDVNPLFDEVLEDIECKDSYDPNLDESTFLGFADKSLLEENDDLFDFESKNDEWKKILYNALIDDLVSEDKVFDPEIHDQIFSPTYWCLLFLSPPRVRILFLTPASPLFIFLIGNGYVKSGQNERQDGQNRAREWKEYKKSKPKANLS